MSAKRLFDLGVAGFLLLATLPLLLAISLAIYLFNGPPIFFRQLRPGHRQRPFSILKFRTMRPFEEGLSDHQRMTKLGALLRKYCLDELPQLWNVIRGELSLVGPRPLLMDYLPRYSERQRKRHQVVPGMTGLAQIGGRNALSWEQKFELDVQYVENRSFWLDIKILLSTVKCAFTGRGVNAGENETMPAFTGSGVHE